MVWYGEVGHGKLWRLWYGMVLFGTARFGMAVEVCCGWVRHGRVGLGAARRSW